MSTYFLRNRKRKGSQQDDDNGETNFFIPDTESKKISSEAEAVKGKSISEELKANGDKDDAYCYGLDLVNDVLNIFCEIPRECRLKEDPEWNRYIRTTSLYQNIETSINAGKCNPLLSYEFYARRKQATKKEDTECTQSKSSKEEEVTKQEDTECTQFKSSKEEEVTKQEDTECTQFKSSKEEEDTESTQSGSSEEEDDTESIQSGQSDSSGGEDNFARPTVNLPVQLGSYSPGTEPDRIPYHLYLLMKEVVDIMKRPGWDSNSDDMGKLHLAEGKIRFFWAYFNPHLPTGWKYDRETASAVVASYDPDRTPKYNMNGYTPITKFADYDEFEYDTYFSRLNRREMIQAMGYIHSRKTPEYWRMCPLETLFYCKLCSCFGIDYNCLESASADDVCLMDVGEGFEEF